MSPSATALIDLDALRANLAIFRSHVPPETTLCPAVKANGYGHGIALLLPVLEEAAVEALCVAQLQEALELRALGWTRGVLCLGAPLVGENPADARQRAEAAVSQNVQVTITGKAEMDLLVAVSRRLEKQASVQVKVDTGMGRLGVPAEEALEVLRHASALPEIALAGVYTHFATADEVDLAFTKAQLESLRFLQRAAREANIPIGCWHAANSAAVLRLQASSLNLVRPGLGIYGLWSGTPEQRPDALRPILRVVSRVVAVKRMQRGASVGYGRTFTASRDSVIGVVPIGYADGYRRELSNCGVVTVQERRGRPRQHVPVVGRVSMDQISIDVTNAGDVQPGDAVTLLDDSPQSPNSVEAVARQVGTIPYEITCGLGRRIVRIPLRN